MVCDAEVHATLEIAKNPFCGCVADCGGVVVKRARKQTAKVMSGRVLIARKRRIPMITCM